jgi:hypothetical protein
MTKTITITRFTGVGQVHVPVDGAPVRQKLNLAAPAPREPHRRRRHLRLVPRDG